MSDEPNMTHKFFFGQLVVLKYDFDDLPAGTVGTIVHAYEKGGCYEVEFTTPFERVVTLAYTEIKESK